MGALSKPDTLAVGNWILTTEIRVFTSGINPRSFRADRMWERRRLTLNLKMSVEIEIFLWARNDSTELAAT